MSDDSVDVWRRFYIRTWSDKRVMALSRPPPNGQTLLTWLIAGKQTGVIPGLFEIGERAFAEMLGWPLHGGETLLESIADGLPKGFREAFAEVSAMGFVKADWKARLVYVPGGIKHDPPQSINVVKRWAKAWRLLPECDLKDEAEREIRAYLDGMGKAFADAFEEATRKASAIQDSGLRKQEAGGGKRAARATDPPPPIETTRDTLALTVSNTQGRGIFEHWQTEMHRVHGVAPVLVAPPTGIENGKRVVVNAGGDIPLAERVVTAFVESKHEYWAERGHPLWLIAKPEDFERARLTAPAQRPKSPPKRDAAAEMRALSEEARERARKQREEDTDGPPA